MSKICYTEKEFKAGSLAIIAQANLIIDEYLADGFRLTLRQLYYQFVARGKMANKQTEYKRLGSIINDGRLAGFIDWDAIEDRTRSLKKNTHWDNPGQIIMAAANGFQLDHWAGQAHHVEVWIEKEALSGVISGICHQLDVPYFACKGYVSASELWRAAQRMIKKYGHQQAVIIHLGDHDPSGMDMTRDIEDRHHLFENPAMIQRIALNYDQVEKYNPPPNPAKLTDSRAGGYIAKHGRNSWELDALDPRTLRELIAKTVEAYRDNDKYQKVMDQEREYKKILERVEENWQEL